MASLRLSRPMAKTYQTDQATWMERVSEIMTDLFGLCFNVYTYFQAKKSVRRQCLRVKKCFVYLFKSALKVLRHFHKQKEATCTSCRFVTSLALCARIPASTKSTGG